MILCSSAADYVQGPLEEILIGDVPPPKLIRNFADLSNIDVSLWLIQYILVLFSEAGLLNEKVPHA